MLRQPHLLIKVPGQQDTVLNKSDVAKFGTPGQRHILLINFAARKTVRNHHAKFIQSIESHAQDIKNKIVGQRAIRKRAPQTSDLDKKAKGNLAKVNRIRIPPKRCYQPSPKKGSPKKRKISTASSQESADELCDEPHESDTSQYYKAATKQQESTSLVEMTGASTRSSARDKKKPKRYGDLTELSSSDESSDNGQFPKQQRGISIASYSPPRTTLAETMSPPPHSVIPLTSSSQIHPTERIAIAPKSSAKTERTEMCLRSSNRTIRNAPYNPTNSRHQS